jgi:dTDP-4-amino-4,6-dideoxygalactose transaminase
MTAENKLFGEPLHVGRPNIGDRDALFARINEILDRRVLSNNGAFVQEFESKVQDLLGVRHCVAVCNGTVALEITARSLGLEGEVIVPSYTFVATAHALQWLGLTPVFADIDPRTHNIDPRAIEPLITKKTSGIVGVHLWGRACETDSIDLLAKRHGIRVMYDASHAFGCSRGGTMIGHFGECEVFSFHATKFVNCFEGGAIATNNDELAAKMRLMRNFGFAGFDNVVSLGVNGKLSEVAAAMGLTGLEAMDGIVACNRRNYESYRDGLREVPGVTVLEYGPEERNNYQYVVLEIDPAVCRKSRDEIVEALHAENVIARRYFWPCCHRMEPYRTAWLGRASAGLRNTESVAARVIVMPTGQSVDGADVERICAFVRSIVG